MKATAGYSAAQIALHWLIAGGVLFNYVMSDGMGRALHQARAGQEVTAAGVAPHVLVGMVLVVLVIARIGLRLWRGAPAAGPGLRGLVARVTHGLLYLLILLVPVLGALAWFAGAPTGGPHGALSNLLVLVAAAHVLAALWHHLVLKDGAMRRMLRPR